MTLTEEERTRIIEQAPLRGEIQNSLEGRPAHSRTYQVLNSPIVVTLVGTVALGVLTLVWQERRANQEKELAALQSNLEAMNDVLVAATNDLDTSVTILVGAARVRVALASAVATEAKSEERLRARWERLFDDYLKHRKYRAILAQVKIMFPSERVASAADGMAAMVQRVEKSGTEEEIIAGLADVDRACLKLTAVLGEEVQVIRARIGGHETLRPARDREGKEARVDVRGTP